MPTVSTYAVSTGGREVSDLNSAQRVVDMSEVVAMLEPNANPLLTLSSRLRKKPCFSHKVEWMEDEFVPRSTLGTAVEASASTAIDVTAGEGLYFKAGDLIMVVRTGEVMRVTAAAANTLTVTRGWAGTITATAIGDEFFCVGHAAAELAASPSMILTQIANKYNVTQIFRKPFGGSGTLEASKLYSGPDRTYLRNKSGKEHAIDMERAMFFGKRVESNDGGSPARDLRSMGGLINYVTTNVTSLNSSGLDSLTDLEDFFRTGFRYGSDTKFLFASPLTLQKIDELAMGKLQIFQGEETLGINIKRYVSGHGIVNLVRSKAFGGTGTNASAPQTAGMAFLVDLENIKYRPLRDTKLRMDIQQNDLDGWVDEYLTEATMEVKQEKTHAILRNIDGGAF